MKRIGLTQRVDVVPSYGERRDALDQQWARLLEEAGAAPVPLANLAADADALVDALGLEGVILTGGNDLASLPEATSAAPERDAFEHRLIACCRRRGLPILAVCRGMQMLAAFDGAPVYPVDGHVRTRHVLKPAPAPAVRVALAAEVNSFHGFAVDAAGLPATVAPLARAEDGVLEAMARTDRPEVGIMWHPERERPFCPADVALVRSLFEVSP